MSGYVKYPYHIRHNGVDYKPGEPVEVDDPSGHLLRGAVMVQGTAGAPDAASDAAAEMVPAKKTRRQNRRA